MQVDLHVHTDESDGTWTSQEVVQEAFARGLTAIAITDHDTTDGIEAAVEHAPKRLHVIPGIELGAMSQDGEDVHILGLWIDHHNAQLQEQLTIFREGRLARTGKILALLRELGIELKHEEVAKFAHKNVLSRSHIASALLAKEIVTSKSEAFARFLDPGAPAYVPRHKLMPKKAVELILKAGGVPVLAHPGTLDNLRVLPTLIEAGLVGLEVIHPTHNQERTQFFSDLAKKSGLLPSGGSDCHGPGGKDHVYLGKYSIPWLWAKKLALKAAHKPKTFLH